MRVILFLIGCAFLFSCEKTDAENEFRVVHLQSGSLVFASVKFNTVVFEQDSDGVITGIEFTFEDKDKNGFIQSISKIGGEEVSVKINGDEIGRYYVSPKSTPKNYLKLRVNGFGEENLRIIRSMAATSNIISVRKDKIRHYESFEDLERSFEKDFSR
jgi:hypothetical protein